MQYTIRNVPKDVDRELRRRAKRRATTVNALANEALRAYLGLNGSPAKKRDFSDLVGKTSFDEGFEQAMADFSKVNPETWR